MLDIFNKPIIGIIGRADSASDDDKVICKIDRRRTTGFDKNSW